MTSLLLVDVLHVEHEFARGLPIRMDQLRGFAAAAVRAERT